MSAHWAGEGIRPLDPRTEMRRRCAGSDSPSVRPACGARTSPDRRQSASVWLLTEGASAVGMMRTVRSDPCLDAEDGVVFTRSIV